VAEEQDGSNTVLLGKTWAALDMLTQLQSSAHTPSTLNQVDADEGWSADPAGKCLRLTRNLTICWKVKRSITIVFAEFCRIHVAL
jgi:hypothetical protein